MLSGAMFPSRVHAHLQRVGARTFTDFFAADPKNANEVERRGPLTGAKASVPPTAANKNRAVFMFDTKFAIIRLRLGVWAEYTTADTYNNYDDEFTMGFNEFEDDEYTVVACNQFQDLTRTKDGIGRESCTITTYDSDHPIKSELTVKGTLPSWFKLALVREL